MANIAISDLYFTGSELFSDDESYLQELSDLESNHINYIKGGTSIACVATGICLLAIGYYSGKHGCI
ncbi:MAG: hypothetical protein MUD14_00305 [Hydrococcus sp. Prado102]|jgi:hypothetical protein|nr:hypothetical protein [Hydrococcus sp. Prado102]